MFHAQADTKRVKFQNVKSSSKIYQALAAIYVTPNTHYNGERHTFPNQKACLQRGRKQYSRQPLTASEYALYYTFSRLSDTNPLY